MNSDLKDRMRRLDLPLEWVDLLNTYGVYTLSDLRSHFNDEDTDELRPQMGDDVMASLSNIVQQDGQYPTGGKNHAEPIGRVSTEDITSLVLCDKHPVEDNRCLKIFLKNYSTLDHSKYCDIFTSEGIYSLQELQQVVRNKERFTEILDKISSVDKVNLQEFLKVNLDAAVEQEKILIRLGLIQYFPEKISLETVMKKYADKLTTLNDVPWYFLSKMLMLDYRGRDDLLPESVKTNLNNGSSGMSKGEQKSKGFLEDMFSKFEDNFCQTSLSSAPHPMDILIIIFQCSSGLLRQVVCEKMFMCKLSIPLLLPQFLSGKSTLLIWALRSIVIEDLLSCGELYECSIVSHPILTVLCLRLGEIARPKSKILNEIINGQSHDTFFHRDCENGMMNRILSEGLVEIAWHLPSSENKTKDQLDKIVAFINLRGDGKLHNTNDKFLYEISNVVLVMVDVSELEKPVVMSSLKLITTDTELILMLSKAPSTKFDEKCRETIKKCAKELECENFKEENIIFDFTPSGEKNIKSIKAEVATKLNAFQERKPPRKTLEDYTTLEESFNIRIDENSPRCVEGHKIALKIVQDVEKGKIENVKEYKLPLQCKPWQEWAKLNKEEHRLQKKAGETVVNYVASIYSKKKERHKEQLYHIENPSMLFQTFLDNLLEKSSDARMYYLKWLKLCLDGISRTTIPVLQKNYSSKWNEICQSESCHVVSSLQTELKTLETKLARCSFGLEHLMREIAQSYEAVADLRDGVSQNIRDRIGRLPQIMAEILIRGYPLELMDGDAFHVPLSWVKAVIKELGNLIGNDKKIFVLSVLGIQSSGKSTLLNAMFGLQFAVAAGRCTRGVYAQLVPLCKENPNMKYDYILVVDTEGLRAAELGTAKLQHDNELATLVIGLGDVTLVNIKGESLTEIEDILQIVVHAILKIKLVNKSLKMQPSCMFIHQNVGAPDAAQKLKSGQQRFMETLDKVTRVAGEQEDAPDYCKFKQVIDFDINKNVWYFSDLWKGDPPMAPANPGYSEKVNAVKQALLTDIMPHRASYLTVPKLCLKIEDLWKGILDQNFVFSFKNSLEMNTYSSLESALSDLSWSLKNHALKWLNNKQNVIESHEEIEKLEDQLIRECNSHLSEEYSTIENKLQEFFKVHEDNEMLEQWRENTFLKLKANYEEICIRTLKYLRNEISIKKIQITQKRDFQMYIEEIPNNARKLADELRCQNLSTESVADNFHQTWKQWMMNLSIDQKNEDINIYKAVMNVLLSEFKQDQQLYLKTLDEVNMEIIKKTFIGAIKNWHVVKFHNPTLYIVHSSSADEIFKKTESYIESYIKFPMSQEKCAKDLINFVNSLFKKIIKSDKIFHVSENFKLDMAVCACQLASYEFSRNYKVETVNPRDSTNVKCRIEEIYINPTFEMALLETFPQHRNLISESIERCCLHSGSIQAFRIDINNHVKINKSYHVVNKVSRSECLRTVRNCLKELSEQIESYLEEIEIQAFKEEYVEAIIKMLNEMVKKSDQSEAGFTFRKQFKFELAIHICRFVMPKFSEKHKKFMERVNPRKVFERDYMETYFEMFKQFYEQCANEKSLASILSQHLSKAIETSIARNMARSLADDIRSNVKEVKHKATLLPAILNVLLDKGRFADFHFYLTDINEYLDVMIAEYINKYLFSCMKNGKTKYVEIASQEINCKISEVCEKIKEATTVTLQVANKESGLKYWIAMFHSSVKSLLPITRIDLLSLAKNYNIVDLSSFTEYMKTNLEQLQETLCNTFAKHDEAYLRDAHEDHVYKLISQECKGCTETCPLCGAPCTLSTKYHTKVSKHRAIEHYPQACGGFTDKNTGKLVIENCTECVASNFEFRNVGTKGKYELYRNYKKFYPDWEIDGKATIAASPYWKWFLVHYGTQLAEIHDAETPDIPDAWKEIDIDMARKSLKI